MPSTFICPASISPFLGPLALAFLQQSHIPSPSQVGLMDDPTQVTPSRKGNGNNWLASEGGLGQAGSQKVSLSSSLAAEPKALKATRGMGSVWT